MSASHSLPTGTVTFFFSDVEDSTGLLQRLATGYRDVLERHAAIVRQALATHGGLEVSTEGDSFFAVFTSASDAVAAARDLQHSLAAADWPDGGTVAVRIGLHTGTGQLGHDDYVGIDVHRAARIGSAGHGGQVVVSEPVRALANDATFADLGEHTLKGLERAEHLYQLEVPGLPRTFPPLRTESSRPNNLPTLASRMLGRDAEVAHLERLIAEHRLVTVTGPGGIGKTRLALEVAKGALARFDRGAFFVDLAPIDDVHLVLPAIAATVGASDASGEGLVAALSDGPRLLVLDNCEQVIGAAPELATLMHGAEPLRVLATSQLPLRLGGEHVFRLDPLPAGGEMSPAVELFTARAQQADPAFTLTTHRNDVVRLVAALDGVPLAIELAAARVNVLTPAEVLARLESGEGVLRTTRADTPDRHRSITAAVAWSHSLLTSGQRELLDVLAVFRGGSTMAALEFVAGRDLLDDLAELVDRSLVESTSSSVGKRFHLLAPVRLFVAEQMEDADAMVARHGRFFFDLAAEAYEGLEGDRRARWLAILGADHDNLRVALDRLLSAGDIERGYEMIGNMWRFFHSTGQLDELELWLTRFFTAPRPGEPTMARARALLARAALFYWRADARAAVADYEEAGAIAEAQGDRRLLADALFGLAGTLINAAGTAEPLGDPAEPAMRAHQIYTDLGNTAGVASVEFGMTMLQSLTAPELGTPDRTALDRIMELYRRAGRLMNVAHIQLTIAQFDIVDGALEEARRGLLTALDTAELAGDTFAMAWALRWLAVAVVELGDPLLGARLAGAVTAAKARLGGEFPKNGHYDEHAEDVARRLIGAAADEAFEAGTQLSLAEAVRLARGESA